MNVIKDQYRKSMLFFKEELRKMSIVVGIIFVVVIVVSTIFLKDRPEILQGILREFMDMANESGIINDAGGISAIGLMMNNMKACMISIVIGILPFIFLPLIPLVMNGAIIACIFGLYEYAGMPFVSIYAGLIPHGFFEIPALIISLTMGIYLCKIITMKMFGKYKELKIVDVCSNIVRFYFCIIVPLLIIAGIVEAYITPIVMDMVM